MKHLTKPIRAIHFLVLAFMMTIGTQISALNMNTGDVMYCTSDVGGFVQASENFELSRWPSQKFKFQITKGKGEKKIITFGSEGILMELPWIFFSSWKEVQSWRLQV